MRYEEIIKLLIGFKIENKDLKSIKELCEKEIPIIIEWCSVPMNEVIYNSARVKFQTSATESTEFYFTA